jgi:two-component system chemotaxis sensor kinase CheA
MAKVKKPAQARSGPAPEQPAGPPASADVAAGLRALSTNLEQDAPQDVVSAPSAALNQDPQLVGDFLVEAREHLANIEARLLEIEQRAHTQETLNSAFRSFHTLKGLAGFLEYGVIQRVSHEVETLLDLARNGELELEPATVDVILQAGDYLAVWLNFIEAALQGRQTATPPDPDALLERVRLAACRDKQAEPLTAAPAGVPAPPPAPAEPGAAPPTTAASAGAAPSGPAKAAQPGQSEVSLVKVDTAKLEYLVDMVGELVIAQSLLRHNQDLGMARSPKLQRDIAHLTRVTAEVQKTAMAMRMVPVGQLFRRMTRLVRDLARKSGKLAELEMQGEEVELDRTIVEELADPFVHMLRNSMDHGIEPPGERIAAGKPAAGRIRLKASHQAGMIVIEIGDDGRGLDRARIFRKAVERGLAAPDAVLSDNEVYQLIFEPGFSTAEKVTDVSGRGVGMDVVRKHIGKLRGRIEISSTPGAGTVFQLKLPLTLAIIDGLVVLAGGERYIVPIFAVREMFRPTPEQIFTVEGRGEMVMVRDRLLPVIRLGARLGVAARVEDPSQGVMIVGENDSRAFCLLVDELAGKQEVVIKSLGTVFRDVRGVAGGAILGDGRVGLILDLATLAGDTGSLIRNEPPCRYQR